MANIYIPEQQDEPQLRENYFQNTTAGTLDVLGQTFQDFLYYNPAAGLTRMGEYYFAKDSGKKLSQSDWSESEYFREGIEVGEDGIHEGAAALLAERYDEREARKLVLNRSKGGFAIGAAQFGVGLVASLLDPINVGSAFIPVVNTARFASMVTRYGKTNARLLKGATEGAVGAAVVEPIPLAAAKLEQDKDYTLMDSFMNVVFGTALGGGLHAVGGKLSDALTRTSPDTRQVLTRTAVGQLVEGRNVNVNPVAQADPTLRAQGVPAAQVAPDTVGPAAGIERTVTPEPVRKGRAMPESLRPLNKKPKSLLQFIREQGGISTEDANAGDVKQLLDKSAFRVFKKDGKSLDDLALAAQEAGYIEGRWDTYNDRATINDLLDAIEADAMSGGRVFSQIDEAAVKYNDAEKLLDRANRAGIDPTGMNEADFIEALSEAESRIEADYQRAVEMDGLTEEQFSRLREESQASLDDYPELDEFRRSMDEAELAAADFDSDELQLVMRENEELMEDIRFMDDSGLVPQSLMNDINEADSLIQKAENSYEPATRAAAECLIGTAR